MLTEAQIYHSIGFATIAVLLQRFHCINVGDQPSDFCSGPENHWEVEWNSPALASGSSWRTGHLDVRVSLRDGGSFQVQEMPSTQSPGCPQLLCLGHRVHLCLEHRDQPLKAFRRSCAPEMRWPADVKSWSSAAEYAAAWRHLSFMEVFLNLKSFEPETPKRRHWPRHWTMEVQSLAINALTKRIQEEAKVLPEGILRVADFLNYRVDPILMDNCGAILANKLSKRKVTKVLAGCSSQGLLPALATSRHLGIPVVFAYASVPSAWGQRETFSATIQGRTHWVLKEAISAEDQVIIIDDIVRTGSTLEALKSICQQAGATCLGAGAIIHNRLNGKTWEGDLETLAQVSPPSGTGRAVDISPAVNDLALPEVVAADVLTERVMNEGTVLPGNLLKVYSFINHQVDTGLMDMCGQLLARVFAGFGISKVLTAQTGGLPPAHAVATALRVPLVCARESHENDTSVLETMYSAPSESFTKKKKLVLYVTKESLSSKDTVLVVDDFLATGTTGVALHKLIQQAGATAAGMAFLLEKRFQDGRGKILKELPQMSGRIVSLACIESMSEDGINLDCKVVGDCKPVPSVDDTVMIDRVLECAAPATGYGMINATTFLNHVVDTKLMDQAASLLARRFVDARCTAVLTAEMSGVAPAAALARKLRVPLVCARRELSQVMVVSGGTISAKVEGSTDSARGMLHIFKDHLRKEDSVLVVDDILGNGATALAMQDLCDQVCAVRPVS
eukprot:symbB.v1.2.032003.t1/scaffold3781.1/size50426/3